MPASSASSSSIKAATIVEHAQPEEQVPLLQHLKPSLGQQLGIDVDGSGGAWRNAAAMWLAFCVGAIIPLAPWLLTADFATATAGTVGGSAAGLVAVSAYQARGAGSKACLSWTLARVLLRQAVVTSLAVGLTVFFDTMCV